MIGIVGYCEMCDLPCIYTAELARGGSRISRGGLTLKDMIYMGVATHNV